MRHFFRTSLLMLACFMGLAAASPARAEPQAVALIESARHTLESMVADPHYGMMVAQLRHARGVLIIPMQLKAAFIFGAQGGNGVLLARNKDGAWGYPAFYTIGTGSVGLQIGVQDSEAIVAIMTERGLHALVDTQVKFGADVSAAAGPMGQGVQGDATVGGADVVTYMRNKGLFLGGSLDGAVVVKRQDYNVDIYGPNAYPDGIIFEGKFANPVADRLRGALQAVK